MFVVLTSSIKDYFECLGADPELVAEGLVDDVEDALLDQSPDILVDSF